ncbi:hypothetical protein [uncultured Alsobacter sp.]|uniref:Cap15 family cyclic dinucleotide receptor domain-containing protein n=1 Tax=uncultured Alsobacter sp. TaxID=1748258 RepID=UPI0025E17974|nr:hypothetical protein [uncultured Alsobacter sp.]
MLEHEYSVLGGVSRAKVGRYLSTVAASVSAATVFSLLWVVDLARRFGLNANVPPAVLSLVGAGAVFGALYWLLDRYAWRWGIFRLWLKVPDLSGEWQVDGASVNQDGSNGNVWRGKITIIQSWDRLRVRLRTSQSGSNSVSAAIIYDAADGYRLFYSYRNEPNINEPDLKGHRGFAEVTFSHDLIEGEGEYFNGHGRYTFGRMKLRRL